MKRDKILWILVGVVALGILNQAGIVDLGNIYDKFIDLITPAADAVE